MRGAQCSSTLLGLLIFCGCATEPTAVLPELTSCLSVVTYRWNFPEGDAFVSNAVKPLGGPLCITITRGHAIVTNREFLFIPGTILSTGLASYLPVWDASTVDTATVDWRGDQLTFYPDGNSNIGFLELPKLETRSLGDGVFVMTWGDEDEELYAEWRPYDTRITATWSPPFVPATSSVIPSIARYHIW